MKRATAREVTLPRDGRPFHTTGFTSGYDEELGYNPKDVRTLSPMSRIHSCRNLDCRPLLIVK